MVTTSSADTPASETRTTLPPSATAAIIAPATIAAISLAVRADASNEVTVRISASTAAEIANWSIDHGYLPQHYTRDLDPKPDGEYRPRFDYVAEDKPRPVKIHLFQDRGGCSYFQVGMALRVDASDDQLNLCAPRIAAISTGSIFVPRGSQGGAPCRYPL